MACYEIYVNTDTGNWQLEYDGDVVAVQPTCEEILIDMRAFMSLDAAIGHATNNYIVTSDDDRSEV